MGRWAGGPVGPRPLIDRALSSNVDEMGEPLMPMVHRFSRSEYHALAEHGLFATGRVELLDGEIVHMAAKLTPHAFTVNRLMYRFIDRYGAKANIVMH